MDDYVAMKEVLELGDENERAHFLVEIATLRGLMHKNIVRFMGLCFDPPYMRLVTEFCAGGDLFRALHNAQTGGQFRWYER